MNAKLPSNPLIGHSPLDTQEHVAEALYLLAVVDLEALTESGRRAYQRQIGACIDALEYNMELAGQDPGQSGGQT